MVETEQKNQTGYGGHGRNIIRDLESLSTVTSVHGWTAHPVASRLQGFSSPSQVWSALPVVSRLESGSGLSSITDSVHTVSLMDSRAVEGVQLSGLKIMSLLLVDDVVMLPSSSKGLQIATQLTWQSGNLEEPPYVESDLVSPVQT